MGQPTTLDWNAYGAASASIETAPSVPSFTKEVRPPVRASLTGTVAAPEPAGPTN